MLVFFTILLALLLCIVSFKWILLRRQMADMAKTIARIHNRATNERLTIHTQDRHAIALANAINTLYEDRYRERSEQKAALDGMRQSMANISHDLRTPLTSIIGYVRLLQSGENTPEQNHHYLEVVSGKANSLSGLVSSLFELARLEAGAYQFELTRLDAGEVLSEELAGFYEALTASGEPEIALSDQALFMIGDKTALSRIFSNLLQNMVKYGAGDVRISSQRTDGHVVFCFSNRVAGLSQEDAAQLFRRFFTADRMRSGEGTGLGLSIVKEFVEQMKGEISSDLEEDLLTFRLSWPSVI